MRVLGKQSARPKANFFEWTAIALGLIAVLSACQTPMSINPARRAPTISQPSDRMEPVVFEAAAEGLLKSYDTDLRLAVRPVRAEESALTQTILKRLEQNLISALRAEGGDRLKLRTRSELGKLLEDVNPFKPEAVANIQARAHADTLLITSAHPISGGISLSFAIYDLRRASIGETLAATSGHVLPIDLEMAATATATAAVRKTAVDLAKTLLDDQTRLVSNLRFASRDKGKGGLSGWLSSMLVEDLEAVVPEIRKMRWVPISGVSPNIDQVWVSTETWDQGTQVRAQFRVSGTDGTLLAERSTRIASKSIPFGVWEGEANATPTRQPAVTVQEMIIAAEPGRSALSPKIMAELEQLGQRFAGNNMVRFRIDGHASYAGGAQDPAMTAELRAVYVQSALMRGGVAERQIKTRKYPHPAPGHDTDRVVVTYGPGVQ